MESKTKVLTTGFLEEFHLLLSIFKWPSSSNTLRLLGNLVRGFTVCRYQGQYCFLSIDIPHPTGPESLQIPGRLSSLEGSSHCSKFHKQFKSSD